MNLLNFNDLCGTGKNLQLVLSYDDLKQVCFDLFNEERIRQEKIKENEKGDLVDSKQAMELLGVKAETLWRWNKNGYLCHSKTGKRNFYKRGDLEKILQKDREN